MEKPKETIPKTIGPYTILKKIGRGGMGEVYLAHDPTCDRKIALKRIRSDIKDKKVIQDRFLREAKVAGKLTHPSIVPILHIQSEPPDIYYTMSFVEGETLRFLLSKAKELEKGGKLVPFIGRSIPALSRFFLQICEAIAYTHANGILHRDLKPENVIIGKYGEVMILDWGIATFINQSEKELLVEIPGKNSLTKVGKIIGTLPYLAPEILMGKPASIQTEIYALGVILYQILTLQLPFQRKNVATSRKHLSREELVDPIEMAPHRDIPHQLAFIAKKCLLREETERYKNVEELISDLKRYIEGRPEWTLMAELDLKRKSDWQLEENILLAKNIAISRSLDKSEWASLQISQRAFFENIKIEATIRLEKESQGVGFLLSIPNATHKILMEEGYCIWLGAKDNPGCRLFRSNAQVLEAKGVFLSPHEEHKIRIEKLEDHLKLYIDDALKINFMSHLPLAGDHIGFLHKDPHFVLKNLQVFGGSLNAMVNCLAVPNAFLSRRLFTIALEEYRRISQSFPGRTEGREALFRAGLTLLEQGKVEKDENSFHLALKEFEKLFRTPGAPFEYLGKSLVYEAMNDSEEEAKCLELSLRKFPKHPLLPVLQEHIIYRMHESSLNNRESAYRIILLAIRHIQYPLEHSDIKELLDSLESNWEVLPFMEKHPDRLTFISICLCFWLGKTATLIEMIHELLKNSTPNPVLLGNAFFSLIELGAEKQLEPFKLTALVEKVFLPLSQELPSEMTLQQSRVFHFLVKKALQSGALQELATFFKKLEKVKLNKQDRMLFDSLEIWMHLLGKNVKAAENIFRKYPSSILAQETSVFHFPFGTWLYMAKSPKIAKMHFASVLDIPYPPTTALPSYFLAGRIDDEKGWIERAFWWEKKELYRQLELFRNAVKKKPPT